MTAASSGRTFALASHVRACDCDGHIILLDLRTNRYLGIGAPASHALADHVANWPSSAALSCAPLGVSAVEEWIRQLRRQGLLAEAPAASRNSTSADELPGETQRPKGEPTPDSPEDVGLRNSLEEATSTVELSTNPAIRPGAPRRAIEALRFTRSVASAALGLRYRSLLTITKSVAVRRTRLLGPRAESLEAMTPAVAAYDRLRPFILTARAQCLLDSLTLIGFLARSGFAPRWVVGVRTGPFAAHSWVQNGNTVLNDQHEYVRQFRPIHVV